jgi:hypothetical protein
MRADDTVKVKALVDRQKSVRDPQRRFAVGTLVATETFPVDTYFLRPE